jgi:hypothetical protein
MEIYQREYWQKIHWYIFLISPFVSWKNLNMELHAAHAPHPEATLNFWQARRLGRRLTRRFGWTGDTFMPQEPA